MIQVKVSYPYDDITSLLKMLPQNEYSGIEYHINPVEDDTKYDYWVVFNFLKNVESQTTVCPQENTIFVATEPYAVYCYPKVFLKQFAVVVCFESSIIRKCDNAHLFPPLSEWFVNKSFDELINTNEVKKEKLISIISSNKTELRGQRKRLDFALTIKEHFGDKIDLFGKGINSFDDKWDAVAPYKYSIAIENSISNDYFTEKISDCFLAHTFPLYYGCPNLDSYFSSQSFNRIDITDVDSSIKSIENIISDPLHYDKHLESVINSKKDVLLKYNLFSYCTKLIANKKNNIPAAEYKTITIKQQMPISLSLIQERVKHKIYKSYRKYM